MKRLLIGIILSFFCLPIQAVFAGNSTISLEPASGEISQPITVNIVIDGHGDKFNAAQADVELSSNLQIKDLTFGDCNFSYLRTPSIQDPSFEGIIMQTYLTKCTVYSMTLIPIAKGGGTITFSNEHVKRYGDAGEIFSKAVNGVYSLTAAVDPLLHIDNQNSKVSSQGLYTLNLGVYKNNQPVSNANVILNTVSSKKSQKAVTDKTGTAHFIDLQQGIYEVVVNRGFIKAGETIVNVSGSNQVLSFAINLDTQNTNPLMKMGSFIDMISSNPLFLAGILIIGIIVGVVITFLVLKWIENKKKKMDKKKG